MSIFLATVNPTITEFLFFLILALSNKTVHGESSWKIQAAMVAGREAAAVKFEKLQSPMKHQNSTFPITSKIMCYCDLRTRRKNKSKAHNK